MKLLWLGYLVYSLGNCVIKLCIETGRRKKLLELSLENRLSCDIFKNNTCFLVQISKRGPEIK